MSNIVNLHDYDTKCAAIMGDIIDIIEEKYSDMSLPMIIGCFEMAKMALLKKNYL